jgi:hypothetical protein
MASWPSRSAAKSKAPNPHVRASAKVRMERQLLLQRCLARIADGTPYFEIHGSLNLQQHPGKFE